MSNAPSNYNGSAPEPVFLSAHQCVDGFVTGEQFVNQPTDIPGNIFEGKTMLAESFGENGGYDTWSYGVRYPTLFADYGPGVVRASFYGRAGTLGGAPVVALGDFIPGMSLVCNGDSYENIVSYKSAETQTVVAPGAISNYKAGELAVTIPPNWEEDYVSVAYSLFDGAQFGVFNSIEWSAIDLEIWYQPIPQLAKVTENIPAKPPYDR